MLQREKNRLSTKLVDGDADHLDGRGLKRSMSQASRRRDSMEVAEYGQQRGLLQMSNDRVQGNSLLQSHAELKESRYFHGIVTFMSRPLGT